MAAVDAAVLVMEKEGIAHAFGVPGAAINALYAAMRRRASIAHTLARHVEGASHMAEGYTRARSGNIGVRIGTSGPAGTDMITGLYSAQADSIPILCITGQAPRPRLYKEDFQAVDIEAIARPVTKWAVTVREPALVPRAFQQAFHLMRSGRPGPVLIDLPFDVQMAEIEFDPDTYQPLPVYKPGANRAQIEKALAMLNDAEWPLIVAGGGIVNADASRASGAIRRDHRRPGHSDAHGLGDDTRRPPADGGDGGIADGAPLWEHNASRVRFRVGNRQPLGQSPHRRHRYLYARP
jgi:tartronate-semialdehyde synthase